MAAENRMTSADAHSGYRIRYPNDTVRPITFADIKDQSGCLTQAQVDAWLESHRMPQKAANLAGPAPYLFGQCFHPDKVDALVSLLRTSGEELTSQQLAASGGLRACDCSNALAAQIRSGLVRMRRVRHGNRTLTAFTYQGVSHV